jgi:hypothetical protein
MILKLFHVKHFWSHSKTLAGETKRHFTLGDASRDMHRNGSHCKPTPFRRCYFLTILAALKAAAPKQPRHDHARLKQQ